MNSLEAIEKLRIGHEQEAQQCIEIFRSFCQWYQSQYNFEQIESTFWNACIYLIEKHDLSEEKLIDFFLSQLGEDAKGKDEKQRGIDSLIYAYLQVKYTQNKKMTLEDVDKKSKNRTSKWKNLLKSRKYEKQKCRIDEKFSKALLQLKSTEIDFISDKLEQGYSSYEQLEQALLEKGYGLDDVSVRIDSMRQDYEQQKHDALERVVHKKEIRTIKMEELRSEVEQLKEGQMMEIIFDGR